jgi:broad specificity phosphatase PhoE
VSATTRLVLVRHTEPHEDVHGRCYGQTDCALSSAGSAHAERLAETFAGRSFDALYSSPLRRALATAEPIGRALGLEPVPIADLREIDCGELEGLTWDEVAARFPELYAWNRIPAGFRFPGGESYGDLAGRAVPAIDAIRDRHPGATVVVVAHGGVIRTALNATLGMAAADLFRIALGYGGISIVDWTDGGPVVRLVNGDRFPASL